MHFGMPKVKKIKDYEKRLLYNKTKGGSNLLKPKLNEYIAAQNQTMKCPSSAHVPL